ncbi:hypothetical protein [Nonomuraea indica]|uniref:Uncharacterized protein n=1 Tax=Nonomuraea indica TaxID=1581193 RepID=A0ABW8A685_9ACTN
MVSEFHPGDDRYAARTTTAQPQGAGRETAQQARSAAGQVAGTAMEQAQNVAGEARAQTQKVVGRLQDRLGEQAQRQSGRAANQIRLWADELAVMGDSAKPDSPLHGVVQQIAGRGRQAADYLENQGLAGVIQEVQEFARRRPGLFLAGMAAAGFLIGRAAKAVTGAQDQGSTGQGPPETEGLYGPSSPQDAEGSYGTGLPGAQEAPGSQGLTAPEGLTGSHGTTGAEGLTGPERLTGSPRPTGSGLPGEDDAMPPAPGGYGGEAR